MIVLIDGNSVGHAHHNSTRLTSGDMETQTIYGYARMLRDLKARMSDAQIMVLWDGRAQFRYNLFPGYKGKRKEALEEPKAKAHRESYYRQITEVRTLLEYADVTQVRCESLEADDLAGYFVRRGKKLGDTSAVLLVSSDRDWIQLIDEWVTWFDPRGETRTVDARNLKDETGYASTQMFLEAKALMGDSSDSIPGVGGIGEKGAAKLLEEWGSVQALFAAVDKNFYTPKTKAINNLVSSEGRDIYRRNLALMNLSSAVTTIDKDKTTITRGKFDEVKLRELCDRFGFMSITRDWDRWVAPFKYTEPVRKAA